MSEEPSDPSGLITQPAVPNLEDDRMKSILALALGLAFLGLSIPQANAEGSTPEKDWTLMVFLNGDNNLDSFGTADMKEMEMVGSNERVNVVVLRDTNKLNVSSKIFHVEKGSSRMVKDYGSNIDMGDWQNLVEFFRYTKENFPAKNYFVDIWNHGGGWKKKLEENDPQRGISYDDHSGNHITTPQLGEAFRQMQQLNGGKKIGILGMDACVMQMAEVAYEVKDSARIVIGSEDNEPADGWAYQLFLTELLKKPEMSAEELGVIVEREYARSYDGGVQGRKTVQGSAVSTEKLTTSVESLNAFLSQAIALAPIYHSQFKDAMKRVQQFGEPAFKDLQHYLMLLRGTVDPGLQQLIDDALKALGEAVLGNFITGSGLGNSHGIAIWIPDATYLQAKRSQYAELNWARDSLWDEFLDAILVPKFPLLSIGNMNVRDQDGDGFLKPGEAFTVEVEMKNESTTAARDVRLSMIGPSGAFLIGTPVVIPSIEKGSMKFDGPSAILDAGVSPGSYSFRIQAEINGIGMIEKDFQVQVDKEYTLEDYAVSTPHPYPSNMKQEWEISKAGAEGIRIHFARFETETRFDTVQVFDKAGNLVLTLDGIKDAFWTPVIPGDLVRIRIQTDGSVAQYGFDIDRIAY